MNKILIIYPHWHPCNLAGVHRPRLIGNFLPEFGWRPVVLTVEPEYYEEKPDMDFSKTFRDVFEVHRVNAFKLTKPRIIGDIGLRALFQLWKKALKICRQQKIHFIWIPIPSFYTAVIGRMLHKQTGIPYGIDYIDPWVRDISRHRSLRARLSILVAKILEPYAVKKASLISGVSESYFQPVIHRNFKKNNIVTVAMPYGFDQFDHAIHLKNVDFPWSGISECKPIVYAGAFLPHSGFFVDLLLKGIKKSMNLGQWENQVKLFFIGTGNYPHKSIQEYARDHHLNDTVTEINERFPYLHILNILSAAYGVMIIGSTEKHYTASKTFQALLSKKPVFSIFHTQSSAWQIMNETRAGQYTVGYNENIDMQTFEEKIRLVFLSFIHHKFSWKPDYDILQNYSARQSAKKLVEGLIQI